MTTFGELVASIHSALHSYTGIQEQVTWLEAPMSSSDTSISVGSSDAVLRGIAEVDDELLYVQSSDAQSLTLAPFGRGYRGSTATSHSQNAMVTFDPAFPKVEIKRAIQQCVDGLYPQLYRIKTADLTYSPLPVGYDLPADCEQVLEVKAKPLSDPLNYWVPVYRWDFDTTSPEVNGKTLNLLDNLQASSSIRVVYLAKFGTFASDADTLASKGLSDSMADLIMYGACARLVRFVDPSRIQVSAVENLSRSQVVQVGDAGKIANQLYAMYQQRLTEERRKLLELTPARMNFKR